MSFLFLAGQLCQVFVFLTMNVNSVFDGFWKVFFGVVGLAFVYFGLGLSMNTLTFYKFEVDTYYKYLKFEIGLLWFSFLLELLTFTLGIVCFALLTFDQVVIYGFYVVYLPFNILFLILLGSLAAYTSVVSCIHIKTTENESETAEEFNQVDEKEENPIEDEDK